jgi:hypothetical protein
MKTAYELALDEFKDASAAVRVAFAAHAEARAAQIIANRNYTSASEAYGAATIRLAKADDSLTIVKEEPPVPADIDVSRSPLMDGVTFVEATISSAAE